MRGGYLARERDAADRRVIQVRLARKGAGTFRRLDRHMRRKLGGLLARLPSRDRHHLFRILETLRAPLASESDPALAGAVRKA